MAEDRHRHKPKAVRLSGELLGWLSDQAAMEGRKPNAVIVSALQEYRANHGGEVAPEPDRAPGRSHHPEPRSGRAFTEPREPCRHPAGSVDGGVCQECGEDVW